MHDSFAWIPSHKRIKTQIGWYILNRNEWLMQGQYAFMWLGSKAACWSAKVGFLSHPICISLGLFLFHWLMQLCFHTYPNRIQSLPTGPRNDNNNNTLLMPITTSNSVVYVPHCPLIHAWCTLHSPPDSNGNQVHQHNSSSSDLLPLMLPSITQYFTAINPLLYPAKVDCKQPIYNHCIIHTLYQITSS